MATTIVHARPPSRIPRPPRPAAAPLAVAPEPVRTAPASPPARPAAPKVSRAANVAQLAPDAAALRTFRDLVARWDLREDRAWTMLTSSPSAPRKLTEDQALRVALLVELDGAMGSFLANVGGWIVDPNPGPLLMGRSPVEFLTRVGTPGSCRCCGRRGGGRRCRAAGTLLRWRAVMHDALTRVSS